MSSQILEKEIWIINEHTKIHSISLVVRKFKLKPFCSMVDHIGFTGYFNVLYLKLGHYMGFIMLFYMINGTSAAFCIYICICDIFRYTAGSQITLFCSILWSKLVYYNVDEKKENSISSQGNCLCGVCLFSLGLHRFSLETSVSSHIPEMYVYEVNGHI